MVPVAHLRGRDAHPKAPRSHPTVRDAPPRVRRLHPKVRAEHLGVRRAPPRVRAAPPRVRAAPPGISRLYSRDDVFLNALLIIYLWCFSSLFHRITQSTPHHAARLIAAAIPSPTGL